LTSVHVFSYFDTAAISYTHTHTHTLTQRERDRHPADCIARKINSACFNIGYLTVFTSSIKIFSIV